MIQSSANNKQDIKITAVKGTKKVGQKFDDVCAGPDSFLVIVGRPKTISMGHGTPSILCLTSEVILIMIPPLDWGKSRPCLKECSTSEWVSICSL